jgi:hypothetical protein
MAREELKIRPGDWTPGLGRAEGNDDGGQISYAQRSPRNLAALFEGAATRKLPPGVSAQLPRYVEQLQGVHSSGTW